jgi:uncharacterized protein
MGGHRGEKPFMDNTMSAIRRAIMDEEAGEETVVATEPQTSGDEAGPKSIPEDGLLSRKATAAVGSAFNRLSETTKKHEPTLEDVVRDTLRPMLKSWLEENLPGIVERMVQAEIERVTRGR